MATISNGTFNINRFVACRPYDAPSSIPGVLSTNGGNLYMCFRAGSLDVVSADNNYVINDFNSNAVDKVISAAKGKELNDKLVEIENCEVFSSR